MLRSDGEYLLDKSPSWHAVKDNYIQKSATDELLQGAMEKIASEEGEKAVGILSNEEVSEILDSIGYMERSSNDLPVGINLDDVDKYVRKSVAQSAKGPKYLEDIRHNNRVYDDGDFLNRLRAVDSKPKGLRGIISKPVETRASIFEELDAAQRDQEYIYDDIMNMVDQDFSIKTASEDEAKTITKDTTL